jgi:hypothetical protein
MIDPHLALIYTSFDRIYEEFIYPEYEIELVENRDLGHDQFGEKILGKYLPQRNTAFIDPDLSHDSDDWRRAFTLWHEVGGHGILQGDWLREQMQIHENFGDVTTTEFSLSNKTVDKLERQANLFAANAGAPLWLVEYTMKRVLRLTRPIRYVGPARYCLDVLNSRRYVQVNSFNHLCQLIGYYIRPTFGGISAECIGYQIAKSNWVVNETILDDASFSLRRTQRPRRRKKPAAALTSVGNYFSSLQRAGGSQVSY